MLGDTNRWYVSGYILGVKPGGTQSTTNIGGPCIGYYKATKDSIYNGKTYKIFQQESSFCLFAFGLQPFTKALLREDTISRKIFIVHPDSINECVAMDFGMNVGDSLYLPFSTVSYPLKNGFYKVDSINIKNEILGLRKHLYLSKYNAPLNFVTNHKYYIEWIESIGATHFPINVIDEGQSIDPNMPYTCKSKQYSSFVTCKYTNNVKFFQDSCSLKYIQTHFGYNFSGDNCEFYGYASDVKQLSFLDFVKLFPNPSNDKSLQLKFTASQFKPIDIVIYNSIGQIVYTRKIDIVTSENVIELNNIDLTQGLYSLLIKSANESSVISFIRN
jgi:hypothetical protein